MTLRRCPLTVGRGRCPAAEQRPGESIGARLSWAAPVRAAHSHGHLLRRGGGHPPLQGCVLWGVCTAHASWVSRPWSPFGGAAMSRSQLRPDPPCRCLRSKCASCPEPAPPAVLAEGTLCPALFPDSLGIHCPLTGTAPPILLLPGGQCHLRPRGRPPLLLSLAGLLAPALCPGLARALHPRSPAAL